MQFSTHTKQPFDSVLQNLQKSIQQHGFGVLQTFNLKSKLNEKGILLNKQCQILELCNPQIAGKVLNTNIEFSPTLPCRIAVYEADEGEVKISFFRPTLMLTEGFPAGTKGLSEVNEIAKDVEKSMVAIVKETQKDLNDVWRRTEIN